MAKSKKVKCCCGNGHVFVSTPFRENEDKPCPKCGDTNTTLDHSEE